MATQTNTGLPQSTTGRRWHFDIYALLEGTQELYFGHETQVNVNMVERVRIETSSEVLDKCYLSPTKRRGVERRSLIWSPIPTGQLLGDKLGCGIPHTCAQPTCPICTVYGGLIVSDIEVELDNKKTEKRKAATFIGRLVHGGGVAVQALEPSEKQRAMHPSVILKEAEEKRSPQPFKREYNEPGLLYPVYNHALSVSEEEFSGAAYAFLETLARLGAGNPKGLRIYEADLLAQTQPMLVVDQYLTPLGKRPVISPQVCDNQTAINEFSQAALSVHGQTLTQSTYNHSQDGKTVFQRWVGDEALKKLQDYALTFTIKHLA